MPSRPISQSIHLSKQQPNYLCAKAVQMDNALHVSTQATSALIIITVHFTITLLEKCLQRFHSNGSWLRLILCGNSNGSTRPGKRESSKGVMTKGSRVLNNLNHNAICRILHSVIVMKYYAYELAIEQLGWCDNIVSAARHLWLRNVAQKDIESVKP